MKKTVGDLEVGDQLKLKGFMFDSWREVRVEAVRVETRTKTVLITFREVIDERVSAMLRLSPDSPLDKPTSLASPWTFDVVDALEEFNRETRQT